MQVEDQMRTELAELETEMRLLMQLQTSDWCFSSSLVMVILSIQLHLYLVNTALDDSNLDSG